MKLKQLTTCSLTLLGGLLMVPAQALPMISLTQLTTGVNTPIGIDYYEPNNTMVGSVNYSSGSPFNFVEIQGNGSVTQFSAISGLTDEIKIATVRSGNVGGFTTGDFFTGNGIDGQIVKVTTGGLIVINPWVDLPGAGNGLMRGSLHVDRTGVYGGDLIVATTDGEVWRVNSAGAPTKLADVNVHLEGLLVVPNDVALYGPLAGKIISGAEGQGLMYVFDAGGLVTTHALGVAIEDIDLITGTENFFGMAFANNAIFGAAAAQFLPYANSILLTQEIPAGGSSGLFRLSWNGSALVTEAFGLNPGSAVPRQWEHVSFGRAGIDVIPPVPEPATLALMGLGLALVAGRRRRF